MKKIFLYIFLSLLLIVNANSQSNEMNLWIAKGYKIKTENFAPNPKFGGGIKIFTLTNKKGYLVLCSIVIVANGDIRSALCIEQ